MNQKMTRRNWLGWLAPPIAVGTIGALWYSISRNSPPLAPTITPSMQTPKLDRRAIFDSHVSPILLENKGNHKAIRDQCSDRIRDQFKDYHSGVEPFVEDITSTWTRLGILKRMPLDWWKEDDRIEKFVMTKFEKHLFSEGDLNRCITESLSQLKGDLIADQASLLTKIKVSVSESEFPEITIPSNAEFDRNVTESLSDFASREATNSVKQGLSSLVKSEVASAIATGIVARVVASIGATAASTATTSGGATAGGAATGAGAGSFGGPVGTAIGLGIGLVVGIAVDWWSTERFRENLRMELHAYLYRLEQGILHGTGDNGLETELDELMLELERAQTKVLEDKILNASREG